MAMFFEYFIIGSSFLGVVVLTPLLRRYAIKKCLIDFPNERSSHTCPTPRGGGLSIVAVFFVGFALLACFNRFASSMYLPVFVSSSIVAVIGFWDDHGHVPACWRVLTHFGAAFFAVWYFLSPLFGVSFNLWYSLFCTFLLVGFVWLINLYNFMDGIDSFACAEALFVCVSVAIMFLLSDLPELALLASLLAASVAGFLIWNLPPARIFLGDVGSGFIGVIIGILALSGIKTGALNIWVWMILLGVFLVDATVTVFIRIARGEKWYTAHRSHAYQHAAVRFKSHAKVSLVATMINIFWLLPWALAAWRWPQYSFFYALIALVPIIWLVLKFDAGKTATKTFPGLTMSKKSLAL